MNPKTQVIPADILTPLVSQVLAIDADTAYGKLVVNGAGSAEAKKLLSGVQPADLLTRPIVNAEAAGALLAGLWLWHDWLHESHELSQALVSSSGSFWHAIMHRREGDFSNAKYWYARCRTHPAIRVIAVGAAQGMDHNDWNPASFTDWVERVYEHPEDPTFNAAVELQRLEWRTLFADCAYTAAGAGSILGGGIE
jgi:hypothetical protein